MLQHLSTVRKTRLCALLLFALVLSCALFLFPGTSHAQTLQSPRQTTYTITEPNGQVHVYKVSRGQDLVIPITNGTQGTIHYSTSVTMEASNSKHLSGQSHIIPQGGCGTASTSTSFHSLVGLTVASYTIQQYFCNNGRSITYLPSPSQSWWTIPAASFSNNSVTNWRNGSYFAYTRGNYNLSTGIPTPWGPLGGSTCSGWIQLDLFGDGFNNVEASGC